MPRRNFADPDYEPTDEDFLVLVEEAFAPVRGARARRLKQLREQIRAERDQQRDPPPSRSDGSAAVDP